MNAGKFLIVNADDFGLSRGVNAGIIRAHEKGILSSTSLMVRATAASEAASAAKSCSKLGIGLHVDLAEWIFQDGEWRSLYEVVPIDDEQAVSAEVYRQLELFQRLMEKDPTHLDSHQHVHRSEPVRSVLTELASQLCVPLRSFNPDVRYCGDFYGQTGEGEPYHEAITVDAFLTILDKLEPGFTEVATHVGDDETLNSVYRLERKKELSVLCDPSVRAAISEKSITLCSFADLPRLKGKSL